MPQAEFIQQYIDSLLKKAGFDKLPADFLEEQKGNMQAEIKRRLGLAVAKHSGEKVENFDDLVKQVLEKFAQDFLSDKILSI